MEGEPPENFRLKNGTKNVWQMVVQKHNSQAYKLEWD